MKKTLQVVGITAGVILGCILFIGLTVVTMNNIDSNLKMEKKNKIVAEQKRIENEKLQKLLDVEMDRLDKIRQQMAATKQQQEDNRKRFQDALTLKQIFISEFDWSTYGSNIIFSCKIMNNSPYPIKKITFEYTLYVKTANYLQSGKIHESTFTHAFDIEPKAMGFQRIAVTVRGFSSDLPIYKAALSVVEIE